LLVIPAQKMTCSIGCLLVIPAQNVTCSIGCCLLVIPAQAGIQVAGTKVQMDSGLRRNDANSSFF
jgi:hypothetical protein